MATVSPTEAISSPVASLSANTPLPDVMDEEASLQVVAELLEALGATSLRSFTSSQSPTSLLRWRHALSVLSRSAPFNGLIADALLERVSAAFTDDISAFQAALQSAGVASGAGPHRKAAMVAAALESLCASYDDVFPLLRDWCAALRVPGLASCFSVHVRCALLQGDLMSGEEPRQRRALFSFLRQHGRELLSRDANSEGEAGDEEGGAATHRPVTQPSMDPVLRCLHRLTLSQSREVKLLWRSVLEDRIRDKLRDLSDDFSTHFLHEQVLWLRRCVFPFVAMVLSEESGTSSGTTEVSHDANAEAEQAVWCAEMRTRLLRSYARRRLSSFWEILSDYPDSVPALEDLHYCMQSNPEGGLKAELTQTVRHLLASRLHRAGTRTEDILAILINTIHAFSILFPRNEQNSVLFTVIADTLDHLRKRKDCVTAIVQAVMQPGGPMNAHAPPPTQTSAVASPPLYEDGHSGGGGGDALDFLDHPHDGMSGGRDGEEVCRTTARDRPDVLRVLLTSIHRRALVDEYQHVLAEQLLQKPMHDFDTTPEEEVLERLKQVFGETVLDKCAVMVRDMQMSRRLTHQLREQGRPRGGEAAAAAMQPASVSVLSMTTWPALARCAAVPASDTAVGARSGGGGGGAGSPQTAPLRYRPHPSLQSAMEAMAAAYKRLKANQRLSWLPSLGRVELELTQQDPSKGNASVTSTHVFSLFDASVVLFVKEMAGGDGGGVAAVGQLAAALELKEEELRPHLQALSPSVLVLPNNETVAMQRSVASSSDFVFAEDTKADEGDGRPAGLAPERVKLMERMVTSLLKTRGPQAAPAIHSSLKMLAKFEGTNADLLELLQSFIQRGLIVLNDSKLYALPPK